MINNIKSKLKTSLLHSNLISEIPNYDELWERVVNTFPKYGDAGITNVRVIKYGPPFCKEFLIYRSREGIVLGLLEYFPFNIFCDKKGRFNVFDDIKRFKERKGDFYENLKYFRERKGNFNVFVDPKHFREGIGIKLLKGADNIWDINFDQQLYTPAGNMLRKAYLRKR